MKRALPLILLLLPVVMLGHDTWLVPVSFQTAPGKTVRVKLATSEAFPTSEAAAGLERVGRFAVRGPTGTRNVEGYRAEETFLVADVTPTEPGHAVVIAELKPRAFVLEPKVFNEYIRDEELKSVIDARIQQGKSDAPGRERYRKIAKAILCVGDANDKEYAKPVGSWLEIVPEKSPCRIRAKDVVPFRVLFEGKPLAHASLAAGFEGVTGHKYPIWGKTDKHGRLRIPFDRPGVWFVRTLHMVPTKNDAESDWDSAFSTLTFEVKP